MSLPTVEQIATDIALAAYDEHVQVDLRRIWRGLIKSDIEKMNPQRLRVFRRQHGNVQWRGWSRDDIVRRAHDSLRSITDAAESDPHCVARIEGRPTGAAILGMAAKRAVRTAVSVAAGGGGSLAVLSQFLPMPWAIGISALAGIVTPGIEKGVREAKRATDCGVGWSDILKEIWDVVSVVIRFARQKKTEEGGDHNGE